MLKLRNSADMTYCSHSTAGKLFFCNKALRPLTVIQTSQEHYVMTMYVFDIVWTLQNLQPCSHSVDCVQSLSLHNEIDNLRIIRRVDIMVVARSEHCLCGRKGVAMINRLLMRRHTELAIATNNQLQPTHKYCCCYNRADLVDIVYSVV